MCLPMAALSLAAGVMSAVGTGVAAISANQQAQYRAKIDERNAQIEREAANQENENTRTAALDHYRKVAQLKGQQVLGAAANGVSTDFGTAADSVADTDMLASEDVNRIYKQGAQNVRGRDINAWNNIAQANASRAAGSSALLGGAFNTVGTALSGASQYQYLKSGMPKAPKVSGGGGGIIVNRGTNVGFGL